MLRRKRNSIAYKISHTNVDSTLENLASTDRTSRAVVLTDKQNLIKLKSVPKVRDKLQTVRNAHPFMLTMLEAGFVKLPSLEPHVTNQKLNTNSRLTILTEGGSSSCAAPVATVRAGGDWRRNSSVFSTLNTLTSE